MSKTDQPKPVARVGVVVRDNDNVATLLDNETELTTLTSGLRIEAGIGFGHKVALCALAPGAEVIKYGVVIGHATTAINAGEHVHVHNVR
tara:strand:- start:226 stop:495 length:270 start_codon:yes stop_codon:yes gene_type:complete